MSIVSLVIAPTLAVVFDTRGDTGEGSRINNKMEKVVAATDDVHPAGKPQAEIGELSHPEIPSKQEFKEDNISLISFQQKVGTGTELLKKQYFH
jgi:hypothetical protein